MTSHVPLHGYLSAPYVTPSILIERHILTFFLPSSFFLSLYLLLHLSLHLPLLFFKSTMAYIRGPFVRLFFFVAVLLLSHSLIGVEAARRRHKSKSSHHPKPSHHKLSGTPRRPRLEGPPCTATYTRIETYTSTHYVDFTPTIVQSTTQTNTVATTVTVSSTETKVIVDTTTVTSPTYTIPPVIATNSNLQKRSTHHMSHHPGHFCKIDATTTTIVERVTRTADPVTVTSVVSEEDTTIVTNTDVDTVKTTTTTTDVVVPTQNAYLCSSDLFKSDVKFSYSAPNNVQIASSGVDDAKTASDCCVACFALAGCVAWTHDSNCTVSAITNDPNGQCGVPEVSFTGADVGGVSGMGPCGLLGSA